MFPLFPASSSLRSHIELEVPKHGHCGVLRDIHAPNAVGVGQRACSFVFQMSRIKPNRKQDIERFAIGGFRDNHTATQARDDLGGIAEVLGGDRRLSARPAYCPCSFLNSTGSFRAEESGLNSPS